MKEAQLQKSVVEWLRLVKPDCLWFAVPNEGYRDPRFGARMKAQGMRAGVADLVFVARDGKAHFLELKTPNGRVSSTQLDFWRACDRHDAPYRVCRSFEEVQGTLKGWGLVS